MKSDDKVKELKNKIENELKKLEEKAHTPDIKALYIHGKLFVDTSEKIAYSIDNLSESSKRLEKLTIVLTVLTIILAISTIYDIFLK